MIYLSVAFTPLIALKTFALKSVDINCYTQPIFAGVVSTWVQLRLTKLTSKSVIAQAVKQRANSYHCLDTYTPAITAGIFITWVDHDPFITEDTLETIMAFAFERTFYVNTITMKTRI